jgi:hypothetical protein
MAVKQPWQDNYQPQSGEYGDGYSGDLNKGNEQEYLEHDAKVDATRAEFGKPKEGGPPASNEK